ncbi:MAG TPA: SRPBCC family protein [Nocardioides sp.]|nr:SRPBCC family protein [Nocardioides sp.]
MKIERTVETTADPTTVFAYLSDFTTTTEWDPGTVVTERISGDGEVGTTYRNVSEFRGRKTELEYRTETLVPPSLIVLHGTNKTVDAIDRMEIAATADGGTRVTYSADFTFKGLAKLATPFLGGPLGKLGDEAQEGMRKALARLATRP